MTKGITTIDRDIAAGEVFKHTGSVQLNGNIGAGAKVEITDGGLKVSGDVGDDATVEANGGSGNGNVSIVRNGNSVTITGGVIRGNITGVTIRNGQIIT